MKKGRVYKSKTTYLTTQGLNKLKAELDTLIKVKRPEALDNIQKAREFGELPENSELQIALDEQARIEERIGELEESIRNAKIIKHDPNVECTNIELGSTVKVQIEKSVDVYTIVGKTEANPSKKMISTESPLGKSLLGAKVGEVVEISTPTFKYSAKILEIH